MPNPYDEFEVLEDCVDVCLRQHPVLGADSSARLAEEIFGPSSRLEGMENLMKTVTNDMNEFVSLVMRGLRHVEFVPKDFKPELPPNFRELCGLPPIKLLGCHVDIV
jgi:hypothetical protein